MSSGLIVVGTGLAGYSLVKEYRKRDKETPILCVTEDDGAFYSKPTLSTALAHNKQPEDLVVTPMEKMATQLSVTIQTHTSVTGIDRQAQQLVCGDQTYDYDQLVLACGSVPRDLHLQGSGVDRVLSVNSLADYQVFRGRLSPGHRVVIIGAGLVGCEFAHDLIQAGYDVAVVAPESTPLEALLPSPLGSAFQESLSGLGVQWHLGCLVDSIESDTAGAQVHLNDGVVVTADLVLSAAGLVNEWSWLEGTGLTNSEGIVVSADLSTEDAHIYAMGDCAVIDGQVRRYIAPIMHQARALSATLTGEETSVSFPLMPVVVKTPSFPLCILPPPVGVAGSWECEGSGQVWTAAYRDNTGQLKGFALAGEGVRDRLVWMKQVV